MLSVSCDTMEVRSELSFEFERLPNGIEEMTSRARDLNRYKINLHKMGVKTIRQAVENVQEAFEGAQTLTLVRVDLKFDYTDISFHEKYKLHRLLLSLAAIKYNISNIYMDTDFVTGELISCKFDTDTREAQYYNKERQKRGCKDLACIGRFEVRSKKLGIDLFEPQDGLAVSLIDKWLKYFRDAATVKIFTKLKSKLNETIISKYDGASLTSYIARYKDDMIFDRAQIIELFSELGKLKNKTGKSADVQASKFLKKYKDFEIIDLARINCYLDELQAIVANATEI